MPIGLSTLRAVEMALAGFREQPESSVTGERINALEDAWLEIANLLFMEDESDYRRRLSMMHPCEISSECEAAGVVQNDAAVNSLVAAKVKRDADFRRDHCHPDL